MPEYLRFFGTNNQQKKTDHFLIYERDLLLNIRTRAVIFYKIQIMALALLFLTHFIIRD